MRYVTRGLLVVAALLIVAFLGVWAFVSSSVFAAPRKAFVERVLSNNLGQQVRIDGDIRATMGRVIQVSAQGLVLPSPSMPDLDLAEIADLSFDLPISNLRTNAPKLANLKVDGTELRLIVDGNGANSWSFSQSGADDAASSEPLPEIFSDPHLGLTNTSVIYQDARNGLDLTLDLTSLDLDKVKRTIHGTGSLNGEAFDIAGELPANAPPSAKMTFEHIEIALNGTSTEAGSEFAMSANIAELGQLLDVLKLDRVLEGNGRVGAVLKTGGNVSRIDDVDVSIELDGGQSLLVQGQVGELGNPEDVSLLTRIRLYPEDAEPDTATTRRDLKLISVDMTIDSQPGQIAQRTMMIETNGFVMDTAGEGPAPVKFSQLSRTGDGKLRVGNINLRIGPPDAPFIILDGKIDDALRLHEVSAEGVINIPASSLVAPERLQAPNVLGEFKGDFHLSGNIEKFALTNLDASTMGTDLWALDVHGSVDNVLKFEDVDLRIDVGVPSAADLMTAMLLDPIDAGETLISMHLSSQATNWDAEASVAIAESELKFTVDLDDALNEPILRGLIESDLIRVDHLRKIIASAAELQNLNDPPTDAEEPQQPGPIRDLTLDPIGRAVLLSGMDMDVDIDLRKIEGAKAASSLQTELTLKDKQLNAGPVQFEFGDAQFDVSASMDLTDGPEAISIAGKAGGWKLDNILHELKFKKGASGTIYADFEVTGATTSLKGFVSSLTGYATVSMSNGSIETQLLDVAGLGVLPWLFSKNKQPVAPITCLRAPLALNNGTISTKQTTLETDQVQIVVYGDVNLNKNTLDIHGQPRKIGEPLKRSPWPFTASGALDKPKIKVKDGPKRLKRSDGADQMPAKRKRCVPDILQLQ